MNLILMNSKILSLSVWPNPTYLGIPVSSKILCYKLEMIE
jgi:hypothetical protein